MTATRDIALTFAGGGNRAFYQLGLMNRWGDRLLPRVGAVAACSAGACVATILLSGRAEETSAFWKKRRSGVTKNFDWSKLLLLQRPTPHGPIYRDTMIHAMRDGGLERLHSRPFPILVLTAGFPRRLPAPLALALGFGVYSLERKVRPLALHPRLTRRVGFRADAHDARECETPEELADLILASSATPPFTPVGSFRGDRALDGGLVDNAPAFLADRLPGIRKNIVFLTRPYPDEVTGEKDGRLYVAPQSPVPVERWDYTRPDLVDATVEMGERDAERLGDRIDRYIGVT